MARTYRQGLYTPRHPEKYKGNINNIVYRSSWEYSFCQFLDNNPNIVEWGSEVVAIPYVKPTDRKVHRYFPDFYIKYKNKHGHVIQEIIEIKPEEQTRTPTMRGRKREQLLVESIQYVINIAKWKAANQWCKQHGVNFRILTEKQLFKN